VHLGHQPVEEDGGQPAAPGDAGDAGDGSPDPAGRARQAPRRTARHGATATLFTFTSTASATQRAFLATLPPSVSHKTLLPVDLSDLNTGSTLIETLMAEECSGSLPSLCDILAELK
jgi:hydroquinone glucosyltransferase